MVVGQVRLAAVLLRRIRLARDLHVDMVGIVTRGENHDIGGQDLPIISLDALGREARNTAVDGLVLRLVDGRKVPVLKDVPLSLEREVWHNFVLEVRRGAVNHPCGELLLDRLAPARSGLSPLHVEPRVSDGEEGDAVQTLQDREVRADGTQCFRHGGRVARIRDTRGAARHKPLLGARKRRDADLGVEAEGSDNLDTKMGQRRTVTSDHPTLLTHCSRFRQPRHPCRAGPTQRGRAASAQRG